MSEKENNKEIENIETQISESSNKQETFEKEIIEDIKNEPVTEKENTGIYYPLDTIPYNVGKELTLEILYQNQQYIGSEVLYPVASIYKIEQAN